MNKPEEVWREAFKAYQLTNPTFVHTAATAVIATYGDAREQAGYDRAVRENADRITALEAMIAPTPENVEKVARAIHGQLGGGTGGYDDAARAAIEAVFDALAEPSGIAKAGLACPVHHDGENWDEVQRWLATLRKQALG